MNFNPGDRVKFVPRSTTTAAQQWEGKTGKIISTDGISLAHVRLDDNGTIEMNVKTKDLEPA